MRSLYRLLAEKQIRVPRTIAITRWLSMIRELSEEDLNVENEVLSRSGKKDDIDFLVRTEDKSDPGYSTLLQDMRWWNQFGFRCLYVGYVENEKTPCILEYWVEDSDNDRFKKMEFGDMYRPLDSFTVQVDGAYACKGIRGRNLFSKFLAKGHKLFYQRGKKVFRAHVACSSTRIPAFKMSKKSGYVPNHWISQVKIILPFFRSTAFVHHQIKDSERGKFPLTLFDRVNEQKI